jgi:hypothetical protein
MYLPSPWYPGLAALTSQLFGGGAAAPAKPKTAPPKPVSNKKAVPSERRGAKLNSNKKKKHY